MPFFPSQAPLPKFCFGSTTLSSSSTLHRPNTLLTPPNSPRLPSSTASFSPCTRRCIVARQEQQPRLSRTSSLRPAATLHASSPRYSLCTPRRHSTPGAPRFGGLVTTAHLLSTTTLSNNHNPTGDISLGANLRPEGWPSALQMIFRPRSAL